MKNEDLLYVVTLEGVYRQGILGIYDNLDDAVRNGREALAKEKDDYHQVHISYIKKNTLVYDCETVIELERNDLENKIYERCEFNDVSDVTSLNFDNVHLPGDK